MESEQNGEKIVMQGEICTAGLAASVGWSGNNVDKATSFGSGGASPTPRKMTLDLTTEKDRATVRNAAARRPAVWRTVDEGFKDLMANQLVLAADDANNINDPFQRASVRTSITRTGALLVGQNQAQEEVDQDRNRLDTGKFTGCVEVRFVNRMEDDAAG